MLRGERGWFVLWAGACLGLLLASGTAGVVLHAGRPPLIAAIALAPSVWLAAAVWLNRGAGRTADPFRRADEWRSRDVTTVAVAVGLYGQAAILVAVAANVYRLTPPGLILRLLPHPDYVFIGLPPIALVVLGTNAVGWRVRRREVLAAADPDG